MEKIANEPIINKLGQVVHYAVRGLAVLMTLVILWGVIDVQIVIATALMAISRKITLFGEMSDGWWLVKRWCGARANR